MTRRTSIIRIPFADGQHEDIDAKMLPDGFLSRVRNMRLRKDGRFGVRFGFVQQSNVAAGAVTLTTARSIYKLRERLLIAAGSGIVSDLYEFPNGPSPVPVWRGTPNTGVSCVSGVKDISQYNLNAYDVRTVDCAAANGYVCCVSVNDTFNALTVQVTRASDGVVVLMQSIINGGLRPRVVASQALSGWAFFIYGLTNSQTEFTRYRYNPTSDSSIVTLGTTAAGGTIAAFDACVDSGGNACAEAFQLSGATQVILRRRNTVAGTVTHTITVTGLTAASATAAMGIHVDGTNWSICTVATLGSAPAILRTGTLAGGGTVVTGPTTLAGGSNINSQPGLSKGTNATDILIALDRTQNTAGIAITEILRVHSSVTHSILTDSFKGIRLAAKPFNTTAAWLFGGVSSQDAAETRATALLLSNIRTCEAQAGILSTGTIIRSHLPTIALDVTTGFLYWPRLILDKNNLAAPIVSEFRVDDSRPRPAAVVGADLYVAGGRVQGYDGRTIWDSGFVGPVRMQSVTSDNAGGSIPSSTTITVAMCFEWVDANGDLHQSPVSDPVTIVTGPSDNRIVVVAAAPPSTRPGLTAQFTMVVFRTVNGTKQLRRAGSVDVFPAQANSVILTGNDASIATAGVIYTQGARGALSGILPHESPEPADFICRHGERLLLGGLPNRRRALVSKRQFVNEPIQWSATSSHYVEAPDEIVGVASMDLRGYLFCRQSIHVFGGDGPNDANEGGFSQVVKLPSSTGLKDDRSILEIPEGLVFQGDDTKIYLIPRGGGAPVPFGDQVEDTLALFPTITAAVLLREEQVAVFCATNGTTSKLCVYDLQLKTWMVDEYSTNFPITAACEFQGQLALISGNRVWLERGTHPDSAFITHSLRTGTIKPFDGWGKMPSITFLGELRGGCTLTIRLSFDDGKTFPYSKAFPLTGTAGDVVRRQWTPKRRKGDRFMIEFEATATGGVATEGLAMNECLLEVTKAGGSPRLAAGQRG